MGKINVGRWVLGGIVAGILINVSETLLNVVFLKGQWESAMKALGKPAAESSGAMVVWMIYGLAFGLAAVWVYAAIRPRFGPGAGTAARAGLAVWFLACLLPNVALGNMQLLPGNLLLISTIWSLVETVVATVLGAWLYSEQAAAAPA